MWNCKDIEKLKRDLPLLDYLKRFNWTARRVGSGQEYVGLCLLHTETRPSFHVNAAKNLFYCHGCGYGGDLIRFVQVYFNLSFRDSVAHLEKEWAQKASDDDLLHDTVAFYQYQLNRHPEALDYLHHRGLQDPELYRQLGLGYAPGCSLREHLLSVCGHRFDRLATLGLINPQGRDSFFRRIIFPCLNQGRIVNLYGRSISESPPHRFLPRAKGGLVAWETLQGAPSVILVEGLFDLAVLWQAGFRNTTSALGCHLTADQFTQLCDDPGRQVFIAFDSDANAAGQRAASKLAAQLRNAGLQSRIVRLPDGHDPNSFFVSGASPADFARCLEEAR
ncbi:MAG TPA: CHC2 zinc finger domain-containing protein [Blastocatellia bacterium]|jgi:DNA primase|nr:CHC2 zinc finger domain-containing protein [Blastocatellia bacterium]